MKLRIVAVQLAFVACIGHAHREQVKRAGTHVKSNADLTSFAHSEQSMPNGRKGQWGLLKALTIPVLATNLIATNPSAGWQSGGVRSGLAFTGKQMASRPAVNPMARHMRAGFSRAAVAVSAIPEGAIQEVKTEIEGEQGTPSFRRFFLDKDGKRVSPWHDLPLSAGDDRGQYFMVTEIPKMTKPKMESATGEAGNPIAQDIKKGKLRDYHGPIFWNYGFLPQTWEDPSIAHPELNALGDNDPVDVVEIGSRVHEQGEIVRVKVLGSLAMIDEGELDWKIIAIADDDELAADLNDVEDLETKMPGVVSGIREWFRWYKTPDGKPLNGFGFDEAALGKDSTLKVIEETHDAWKKLQSGETESDLWID